jgi:hypothetical protein
MAGEIGDAKCLRCGNDEAIRIRDSSGWQVSCGICGFFEQFDYQGEQRGYRRECPSGMAHYISKDTRDPHSARHQERFSSEEALENALARLRSQMESGEVYWESVLVTIWREGWKAVEFMMGSPECLHWEPPMRADVPQDQDGSF